MPATIPPLLLVCSRRCPGTRKTPPHFNSRIQAGLLGCTTFSPSPQHHSTRLGWRTSLPRTGMVEATEKQSNPTSGFKDSANLLDCTTFSPCPSPSATRPDPQNGSTPTYQSCGHGTNTLFKTLDNTPPTIFLLPLLVRGHSGSALILPLRRPLPKRLHCLRGCASEPHENPRRPLPLKFAA